MKKHSAQVIAYGAPTPADTSVSADTAQKPGAVFASLKRRPIEGVDAEIATPTTANQLTAIHDESYIDALENGFPMDLAESNGIGWDPEYFEYILQTNGAIIQAVETAMRGGFAGACASGLHHAREDHGAGFCTVNGLVLGAHAAIERGAERVLIVDFDAHCGGGTASMIAGSTRIEQVDVSVYSYDSYSSRPGAGLRITDADNYLDSCAAALESVDQPSTIDLVIYNAGMDPHERAGGVRGITTPVIRQRERMVFEWARAIGLPVAFVLAGGYTGAAKMDEVVDLHRITFEEAARALARNGS